MTTRSRVLDPIFLLVAALPASVATTRLVSGQPVGWISVAVFAALALGLGQSMWRSGRSALGGPSSLELRVVLVLVLLGCYLAGLPQGWDQIYLQGDSPSYITHHPVRPPLYPAWIDAFARSTGDPESRFVNVVRAQKVLTGLAVATFVWALSRVVNVWPLAMGVYAAFFLDLTTREGSPIYYNVNCLLSEGVNHALVFFFLASVLAYMARPGWLRGVFVAVVLALLNLNRPANSILCVAFPVLWAFDASTAGWKAAIRRGAVPLLVFALPLALQCAENARKTGHARLHSFTGMNTICMAIQVSTPEDLAAFDDRPDLQKFVKACIVDNAGMITSVASYDVANAAECLSRNVYQNALPAFARTVVVPPAEEPNFYMNEVFLEVSKRILLRHELAFARLIAINFSAVWSWWLDGFSILAAAAAMGLYRRDRAWPFLYGAFLFLLPLVSIVPACLVSFPVARYGSQLGFIRPFAVPLLLAVLISWNHRSRGASPQSS